MTELSPAPPRHRISARISGIAPSATLAVDATAKALKAAGRDVIGFGAGEPDFPTPEHIVAAAEKACRDPKMHHYTPTAGYRCNSLPILSGRTNADWGKMDFYVVLFENRAEATDPLNCS